MAGIRDRWHQRRERLRQREEEYWRRPARPSERALVSFLTAITLIVVACIVLFTIAASRYPAPLFTNIFGYLNCIGVAGILGGIVGFLYPKQLMRIVGELWTVFP
jgi:hypothetical protein